MEAYKLIVHIKNASIRSTINEAKYALRVGSLGVANVDPTRPIFANNAQALTGDPISLESGDIEFNFTQPPFKREYWVGWIRSLARGGVISDVQGRKKVEPGQVYHVPQNGGEPDVYTAASGWLESNEIGFHNDFLARPVVGFGNLDSGPTSTGLADPLSPTLWVPGIGKLTLPKDGDDRQVQVWFQNRSEAGAKVAFADQSKFVGMNLRSTSDNDLPSFTLSEATSTWVGELWVGDDGILTGKEPLSADGAASGVTSTLARR